MKHLEDEESGLGVGGGTADGWFRSEFDSDIEISLPDRSCGILGSTWDRQGAYLRELSDFDGQSEWLGQNLRPDLRVVIAVEIVESSSTAVLPRLKVERSTRDIPVTFHEVEVRVPRKLLLDIRPVSARILYLLKCVDSAVELYSAWAGWVYPGPIPRTEQEVAWVAEYGEPKFSVCMDELRLPKARKPSTATVEKALAGLSVSGVEDRSDEFVEHVRTVRASTAVAIIRGWWRLVDATSTEAHWEVAEAHMDELGLSDDVFHDLRNYVALVAPEAARSTDVEQFEQVVAAIEDFEDVGYAGGIADLLSEIVDERELEVFDLPDLFAIRP